MSRLLLLLGLAGLGVAIALLAHAGLPTVLAALAAAGWPLLWLVPLHILPLALDASGWRVLLAPRDPEQRARLPVLLAAAAKAASTVGSPAWASRAMATPRPASPSRSSRRFIGLHPPVPPPRRGRCRQSPRA